MDNKVDLLFKSNVPPSLIVETSAFRLSKNTVFLQTFRGLGFGGLGFRV